MNAKRLGVISDGISRDVRVAVETARAAGLSDIEFQYMWEYEVGDLPADKRREARALVADNGLTVSCISRHIFARQTVHIERDSAEYREQMDALKRCIDFAHELGASTVRIMSCRRETIGHVHIKDAVVRPQRARVDFCRLGGGDMAAHLQGIADFLRAENYAGSVSLESTYRPPGGDFADGFHESLALFKQIYGADG